MDIRIVFFQSSFVSVPLLAAKSSTWQFLQQKGNVAVLFVNDLVVDILMLLVRLRVSVHYPAHMSRVPQLVIYMHLISTNLYLPNFLRVFFYKHQRFLSCHDAEHKQKCVTLSVRLFILT